MNRIGVWPNGFARSCGYNRCSLSVKGERWMGMSHMSKGSINTISHGFFNRIIHKAYVCFF